MKKILIIEDEKNVIEVVEAYLTKEGYTVYKSTNGKEGLSIFNQKAPDLLVLDLMLPDISGEEICKEVRKKSNVPIIMLTAKSAVEDRIKGLSIGADDYLVKPFSPKELVMRVRTVLRRLSNTEPLSDVISFRNDDLKIDVIQHKVFKKGNEVNLTPVEYKLLSLLIKNVNRVYTREDLIEKVLGADFEGYDRTIDSHIKNLRKKIEDNPKQPIYIKTVIRVGYKFEGE
ncbi:response regulator transcription factor [Haloplasma contractile]|uniref:DNA-binding response regulator protein n=1 Tax=Haloplasma contractile SSD-17B TaxID=1033810 RepID=F7PV21_9MOLU|nr:response regulator transcription factor [Haloplasma contractile]ERJ11256.1 DNA-binding response regulator protein [Haloplasma contractile SSD-17B]